jgi:type IV fimbrial biogenesis protein FimT
MLSRRRQQGFSIIELAVVVSIIGILAALGIPAFSEYIQNARLGTMAQGIHTGLSLARSEAIRRNAQVEFAMTNTPIAAGIENNLVPAANGTNWVVRYQDANDPGCTPYCKVEVKSGPVSGTGNITVTSAAPVVTFNGLGAATAAAAIAVDVRNPTLGLCAPAGPVRCWQVLVAPGGQVHLCDPAAGAGDSRAC